MPDSFDIKIFPIGGSAVAARLDIRTLSYALYKKEQNLKARMQRIADDGARHMADELHARFSEEYLAARKNDGKDGRHFGEKDIKRFGYKSGTLEKSIKIDNLRYRPGGGEFTLAKSSSAAGTNFNPGGGSYSRRVTIGEGVAHARYVFKGTGIYGPKKMPITNRTGGYPVLFKSVWAKKKGLGKKSTNLINFSKGYKSRKYIVEDAQKNTNQYVARRIRRIAADVEKYN